MEEKEIIREFRKRQKRHFIGTAVYAVLIILISRCFQTETPLLPLAIIVIIISSAVFYNRNWRCPKCKEYLGRTFLPSFCPSCGARLQSS